jgi:hypothetical protein
VRARSREASLDALCDLLVSFANALHATGFESWSRFVVRRRSDCHPTAPETPVKQTGDSLIDAVKALVALSLGRSLADPEIGIRACALLGQVSAFYCSREQALEVMGRSHFDEELRVEIHSVVRQHTRAALDPGR